MVDRLRLKSILTLGRDASPRHKGENIVKRYLAAAASTAVLVLVAPALANAQPVGHVDVTYTDYGDLDSNGEALTGAVAFPAGPLNIQLNATGAHNRAKGFASEKSLNLEAHLFHRNESFAVGGMIGTFDEGLLTWGGEGQLYLNQFTASAHLLQLRDGVDSNSEDLGTLAGVQGKFFATDNVSLAVDYASLNPKGGGNLDAWGATGEYKFGEFPASMFVNFQRLDDADIDIWTVGARFHFGAKTLKEQDRTGPSMPGASALRSLIF
jgi:hypothetical protein